MPEQSPESPPDGRRAVAREFLRDLFDLQFTAIIFTRMLPVVYGFGIVLAGLFAAYQVFRGFQDSAREGLLWLALGPVVFLGLVTALRVTLEFALAVFRMAWYVEQVANHTQVVSEELPKFTFLRTLLWGDKSRTPGGSKTPPR